MLKCRPEVIRAQVDQYHGGSKATLCQKVKARLAETPSALSEEIARTKAASAVSSIV